MIFSAETNDCEKNAREKLLAKNADLVVLNDVTQAGAGFNSDTNIVTFITKDTVEQIPKTEKTVIADMLLDRILKL